MKILVGLQVKLKLGQNNIDVTGIVFIFMAMFKIPTDKSYGHNLL